MLWYRLSSAALQSAVWALPVSPALPSRHLCLRARSVCCIPAGNRCEAATSPIRLGQDAASSPVRLGQDAASSPVRLGQDAASSPVRLGQDAASSPVRLGQDAASSPVRLGQDAASSPVRLGVNTATSPMRCEQDAATSHQPGSSGGTSGTGPTDDMAGAEPDDPVAQFGRAAGAAAGPAQPANAAQPAAEAEPAIPAAEADADPHPQADPEAERGTGDGPAEPAQDRTHAIDAEPAAAGNGGQQAAPEAAGGADGHGVGDDRDDVVITQVISEVEVTKVKDATGPKPPVYLPPTIFLGTKDPAQQQRAAASAKPAAAASQNIARPVIGARDTPMFVRRAGAAVPAPRVPKGGVAPRRSGKPVPVVFATGDDDLEEQSPQQKGRSEGGC